MSIHIYPYIYSSQRQHSASQIKFFFGHERHDKACVSHGGCALDGGAVFGGALLAHVLNRGIVEVNVKRVYEPDKRRKS